MLTELNLPSYCTNCRPSVALECWSTLYVNPSAMLDCPGSFLCNCNPSFCVAKIVNCNISIKTVKTSYAFKLESIELPSTTHKYNCI